MNDDTTETSPIEEIESDHVEDGLFNSNLLNQYGILIGDLDQRLAPLLQVRCIQISQLAQQLLADVKSYNEHPGAHTVDEPEARSKRHAEDQAMLERILKDVKTIRRSALGTKAIQKPPMVFYRRKESREEALLKVCKKVHKDPNRSAECKNWKDRNFDSESTDYFYAANTVGLATAPGEELWEMADGTRLQNYYAIEISCAINELLWRLATKVRDIQKQVIV